MGFLVFCLTLCSPILTIQQSSVTNHGLGRETVMGAFSFPTLASEIFIEWSSKLYNREVFSAEVLLQQCREELRSTRIRFFSPDADWWLMIGVLFQQAVFRCCFVLASMQYYIALHLSKTAYVLCSIWMFFARFDWIFADFWTCILASMREKSAKRVFRIEWPVMKNCRAWKKTFFCNCGACDVASWCPAAARSEKSQGGFWLSG